MNDRQPYIFPQLITGAANFLFALADFKEKGEKEEWKKLMTNLITNHRVERIHYPRCFAIQCNAFNVKETPKQRTPRINH